MKFRLLNTKPVIKKATRIKNKFLRAVFIIVNNPWFEYVIFLTIMINTLILMIKWYDMPQ